MYATTNSISVSRLVRYNLMVECLSVSPGAAIWARHDGRYWLAPPRIPSRVDRRAQDATPSGRARMEHPMANLRLTFTDPATRRTVTLDAQRTREPSAASDGFVDLGLDGFDGVVRIPSSALSAQDSEALRRALANPEVAGLKVADRLAGATAAVMVRTSDLHTEATEHVATALPGVNLDATGARRPVSFSGGRFSAELGVKPETPPDRCGLYAAAKLIDDAPGNAVDAGAERSAPCAAHQLRDGPLEARTGTQAPDLDRGQTLQLRSSASTVLLGDQRQRNRLSDPQRRAEHLHPDDGGRDQPHPSRQYGVELRRLLTPFRVTSTR